MRSPVIRSSEHWEKRYSLLTDYLVERGLARMKKLIGGILGISLLLAAYGLAQDTGGDKKQNHQPAASGKKATKGGKKAKKDKKANVDQYP